MTNDYEYMTLSALLDVQTILHLLVNHNIVTVSEINTMREIVKHNTEVGKAIQTIEDFDKNVKDPFYKIMNGTATEEERKQLQEYLRRK